MELDEFAMFLYSMSNSLSILTLGYCQPREPTFLPGEKADVYMASKSTKEDALDMSQKVATQSAVSPIESRKVASSNREAECMTNAFSYDETGQVEALVSF